MEQQTTLINCPACDSTLNTRTWKGIQLDVCTDGCHGIWFDSGELQTVEESDTPEHLQQAFEGTYRERSLQESLKGDPLRHCPKDNILMERYEWNIGSHIVMDTCPKCQGIWLDSGELIAYARYIHQFYDTPHPLTPEIKAQMDQVQHQVEAEMAEIDEEGVKLAHPWHFGHMDDMLRGLLKWID